MSNEYKIYPPRNFSTDMFKAWSDAIGVLKSDAWEFSVVSGWDAAVGLVREIDDAPKVAQRLLHGERVSVCVEAPGFFHIYSVGASKAIRYDAYLDEAEAVVEEDYQCDT
jgi:hypothetical protein